MGTRLFRSRDDRMLAGVAGGLAELWDADPSLIRIVWALLVVLTGGVALVVYIVMAIVVPEEDDLAGAGFAPGGAPIAGTAPAGVSTPAPPPAAAGPTGDRGAGSAGTSWRSQRHEDREARRAARAQYRAAHPHDARTPSIVIGAVLVLIGIVFLIREYLPSIDFDNIWPFTLVAIGLVVLVSALRPGGGRGSGT